MANIKWTAIASDSWITLRLNDQVGQQVTGEGDTNIAVETTPSEAGQGQMTGTITFTSEDGHLVRKVSVQRCGSDCGCEDIRLTNGPITFKWNEQGEDAYEFAVFVPACAKDETTVRVSTDKFNVVFSEEQDGYIVYPTGENTTENTYNDTLSVKYASCAEKTLELIQDINGCSCEKVTVNNVIIDQNDARYKSFLTVLDSNCYTFTGESQDLGNHTFKLGDFTIQINYPQGSEYESENWFDNLSTSNNTITIAAKSANPDESTRECTVSISYEGTRECNKEINVTQLGNSPCTQYTITPSRQVDCGGGTVKFTANIND